MRKRLEHITIFILRKIGRNMLENWMIAWLNSRWKVDWGKMMDSGDILTFMKIKKKNILSNLLICGKYFQEFLKDQWKSSRKYSQSFFYHKLKRYQKKQRNLLNLLRNSSELTQNVSELSNFVAITLSYKTKETIKLEVCFPTTWLKEEEERLSLILELKIWHPTSITSLKLTILKEVLSHLDSFTKN